MLSVIIPSKEEPGLQGLVDKINGVIKQPHEIVVVDGSAVQPNIKGALVLRQKSRGLGNAVMEGIQQAKGDIILTMDGDGSHRPEDMPKLLSALSSHDIALGSRFVRGGMTFDVAHRKIISVLFRKFAASVLGIGIQDPMSGFCAFKKSLLDKIRLKPLGMKIILELIYKAKNLGYSYKEVPITFERRAYGKSKSGASISGMSEGLRIARLVVELKLGLR
jgi:glycosyltransferase involved in cell wall biosynthesis